MYSKLYKNYESYHMLPVGYYKNFIAFRHVEHSMKKMTSQ
jgi:hypothetical protein